MSQAQFDSFWSNLTLPFVSFLLFTASLTLSGGKEQKPILTLAHFDSLPILTLLFVSFLLKEDEKGPPGENSAILGQLKMTECEPYQLTVDR